MRPALGRPHRRTGYPLLLSLGAGLVVLAAFFWPVQGLPLLDRLEWKTVDWRFDMRPVMAPEHDVAILSIDEGAIQQLGRWPWPRDVFAELVRRLHAAGARQIVFDVLLFDRDTTPGGAARDAALARAAAQAGNVYLASAGDLTAHETTPELSPEILERSWDAVRIAPGRGLNAVASLYDMRSPLKGPLAPLVRATHGTGFVDVADTGDGIFRHAIPLAYSGGHLFPSLPLLVAADALGVAPQNVTVRLGEYVDLGGRCRIPLDRGGRALINFAGPANTYLHHSVADAFPADGPPKLAFVRGKTIIIGGTATGMNDLKASPFGAVFDGVETQASTLGSLLGNQFLARVSPEFTALITLLMVFLVGLVFPRVPLRYAVTAFILVPALYDALAVLLFDDARLVLDLVVPNLAVLLSVLALLTYRVVQSEQDRYRVQTALSRFVPPEVARHLVENEAEATMTGERREISVLFADIRDFTAASERLAPEAAVELLNRYFRLMHETIWEFGGTLDKFMGDCLMAFFNAPKRQDDHAQLAVMTAIEMQRRVQANRAEWEYYGMADLHIGIGINTGNAVVGYVESGERWQYTVIGSTVNLAARLEELSKLQDEKILISEVTYERIREFFDARKVGKFEVRGMSEPVMVCAVDVPELVVAKRAERVSEEHKKRQG